LAKLVINPTSAAKKEIPLASRVISIGRDPSNDLVLSDSMVSRRHAILEQRDNQYILRDNGSSNGTMVNGDRVEDEKPLRDGDLVAIGSSRLLFQLDDTAEVSLPRSPEPARPSAPAPVKGPDAARCPYCGKTAVAGDRFCRGCGRDLTRDKKNIRCEKCGAEVQLPADFCGQCGGPLGAIEKSDSGKSSTRPHRRSDFEIELKKAPADETPIPSPEKPRNRSGPVAPVPKKAAPVMEPAGFGIRLLAFLVDDMILGIPLLLAGLLFLAPAISRGTTLPAAGLSAAGAVYSVLSALYYVIFWGLRGATPGKSLLGLVVTTDTGETPIGLARAFLRLVGYFVSMAVLGLGFLPILLSQDRRGLHDRIAGTRVARTS
jgi:adenylate cyclase